MDTTHTSPDPVRADRLAHYLLRSVNKVANKFRLFTEGDHILVAVSGGKDSMTLLDLLHRRQAIAPERYQLTAVHITSDYHCGRAVPLDWLRAWCETKDIPLVVEPIVVAEDLAAMRKSRCFRCAWVRRKALFDITERLGCNKLALGHHADDVAETTLMNLLYNARVLGMAPKVHLFGGRLTIIRPLAFIEERDIVPFVLASGFPVGGEPCPAGLDGRREQIKRMLRELETGRRQVKRSIWAAVNRFGALEMAGEDEESDEWTGLQDSD